MTRVLIVGNGAREHALAWKLRNSPDVSQLFVAPGNPGTGEIARNVAVAPTDIRAIVRLTDEWGVDLTVIGPEAPLALGLADALRAAGKRVAGPNAAAARIESSKAFAKGIMQAAGVPTAGYAVFDDMHAALQYVKNAMYPLVIKADGLTAGKGVTICQGAGEAHECLRGMMTGDRFGDAGRRIVIEQFLQGPEVSLLAFVDGERAVALPVAQDHKRLGDGDTGPNTGGMGAYAPVPFVTTAQRDELLRTLVQPVVVALASAGTPYRGILFAGIMLTPDGPHILEYNCRFGDPEAQVVLPLLDGDLLPWLDATADGRLEGSVPVVSGSAVGVVLASAGYPEHPRRGDAISGLDRVGDDTLVFHAGTHRDEHGHIVTAGGRVLTVVGTGPTVDEAAARAYSMPIHFPDMQHRTDIAWQARTPQAGARTHQAGANISVNSTPLTKQPRIVVLASGDGSNLQALIDWTNSTADAGQIVLVVSHTGTAGSLRRADHAGIPGQTIALLHRADPAARRAHEEELLRALHDAAPDLIVLAGWMLVLSPEFLDRCPYPLLNVHPALLPMGDIPLDVPILRGAHAVRDALSLGLPYTGVSVHHVTADVDAGPVIAREIVPILPGDNEETLYGRIRPVGHRLLIEAVQAVLTVKSQGGMHAPGTHANRNN